MIQRIQSVFFLLSALTSILIIFYFPVLSNEGDNLFLFDRFVYLRLLLLSSSLLAIFAIFQYKNRSRQRLISSFSRLMITFFYIITLVFYKEDFDFEIGLFLCIIPFILLFIASYFVKKDEKLIKDSDRIR
jgi:membrane protease YdiL (CAAX protease family)